MAEAKTTATSTRLQRGITLAQERGEEIILEGRGVYEVPGCSGGTYTVDLAVFGGEESCSCPDHTRHPELTCKHLAAASLHRAKSRAAARREQAKRTAARASRASLTPLVAL